MQKKIMEIKFVIKFKWIKIIKFGMKTWIKIKWNMIKFRIKICNKIWIINKMI